MLIILEHFSFDDMLLLLEQFSNEHWKVMLCFLWFCFCRLICQKGSCHFGALSQPKSTMTCSHPFFPVLNINCLYLLEFVIVPFIFCFGRDQLEKLLCFRFYNTHLKTAVFQQNVGCINLKKYI